MHFNNISIYVCPDYGWCLTIEQGMMGFYMQIECIYIIYILHIYIFTLDMELIWVNAYPESLGDLLVFWHCGVISPLCPPPPPPPPPPSKHTPPHTHVHTKGRRPHVLIHTFRGSYMLVTPMRYQHWPLAAQSLSRELPGSNAVDTEMWSSPIVILSMGP